MAFTYLTNVPLEQAKKDYLRLLAEQGFEARSERIRVQDAFKRITARAVYAHINAPHYACSATALPFLPGTASEQRRPPLSHCRKSSLQSSTPEIPFLMAETQSLWWRRL